MKTLEKLTRARIGLVLDQPFFGSLSLRLKFEEDRNIETLATDGKKIVYNPDFIEKLNPQTLKTCLAHEVLHCAMSHQSRRDSRDPREWNIAADLAINPILQESGFTLPDEALIDSNFYGLSAEEIYTKISGKNPDPNGNEQAPGQGKGKSDPGNMGEVQDAPGDIEGQTPTPAQLKQNEQEWKIAAQQAAQQAKAMGRLPGNLARLVQDIIKPRLDWREILQSFVRQNAQSDYNWNPPNRRFVYQGLYLPSLKSEKIPPLYIAIDTSGSIDDRQLSAFQSEIQAIMDTYPTEITCIYCDSEINGKEYFSPDSPVIFTKAKGGGGTDFRPIFDHIKEEPDPPECLIVLTDLEGTFPEAGPPYPVLWVNTYNRQNAPFGITVHMEGTF